MKINNSILTKLYQNNVYINNFALVIVAILFNVAICAGRELNQMSNNEPFTSFPPIKTSPPFIESQPRIDSMKLYNKSGLISYEQFFNYIDYPVKSFCKNQTSIGGKWFNLRQYIPFDPQDATLNMNKGWYFDGNKIVCLDEEIFGEKKDCLVISIGIGDDWTFDDAIIQYGCQVFAFDPTIGQGEHTRNQKIYFYPYGAGKTNRKSDIGELRNMTSMFEIMEKKLGKDINKLTYLKLDIEGGELEVFDYIFNESPNILDKIQQIGMEIHPGRITDFTTPSNIYKQFFEYLMSLERRGFALIHSSMNTVPSNKYYEPSLNKFINGYYELVWAKWW